MKLRSLSFLPECCINDLVTGSWWFVIGSFASTIIPVFPLLDFEFHFFSIPESTDLEAYDSPVTWILIMASGFFFTVGSYELVKSFEYYPSHGTESHINDTITAAWLFLIGSVPYPTYSAIFIYQSPLELQYYVAFVASILLVAGSIVFLIICHSKDNVSHKIIFEACFISYF